MIRVKYLILVIISMIMAFPLISSVAKDDTMILYLPFDEGSGKTTKDASEHQVPGEIMGGAKWTKSGKYGNAINFDGASAYIEFPDSPTLDITDQLTLEAWVILRDKTNHRFIIGKGRDSVPAAYEMSREKDNMLWFYTPGTANDHWATGVDIPTDVWVHVTGTWDGKVSRMYVNAEEKAKVDAAGKMTTNDLALWIGRTPNGDLWWSGDIDEVAIYKRALPAAEVKKDMDGIRAKMAVDPPGKLASAWGFIKVKY